MAGASCKVFVDDSLYDFDPEDQKKIVAAKHWQVSPTWFTDCRISTLALFKMSQHAESGGSEEVMGLLVGYVRMHEMIVVDVFEIPSRGTETTVNPHEYGYEYTANYMDVYKKLGYKENVLGWYHSHPGYGCWLSGIDVNTQSQNQQFQDPWLAVVIDPVKTSASGMVNIGAFRTYPKGHKLTAEQTECDNIPLYKIEDYGVHCKKYYKLEISYFKSSVDDKILSTMKSKQWAETLCDTCMLNADVHNTERVKDISDKLESALKKVASSKRVAFASSTQANAGLDQYSKESLNHACDTMQSLLSMTIKTGLFRNDNDIFPAQLRDAVIDLDVRLQKH